MKCTRTHEKLAVNIKALRLANGVSVDDVAAAVGLSKGYIYKLENLSEPKNLSFEKIDALAEYFVVDIYQLFV